MEESFCKNFAHQGSFYETEKIYYSFYTVNDFSPYMYILIKLKNCCHILIPVYMITL